MRIFNKELNVATEEDCSAPWSCGKPGELFRCSFCGHKFKLGDKWRGVFTNDIAGAGGNPLVCETCNKENSALREEWVAKCSRWKLMKNSNEWWFFFNQITRK